MTASAVPPRFPVAVVWSRCDRGPFGWWCSRPIHHSGPCALRRRWWYKLLRPIRYRGWP